VAVIYGCLEKWGKFPINRARTPAHTS
jgi:hypothetical protein